MSLSAPSRLRALLGTVSTLVLGGLLATGLVLPAQAATLDTFTVRVATAAGAPLAGIDVIAIPVRDGARDPDRSAIDAVAVAGQPGTYELADLEEEPYTLGLAPANTATAKAFIQYLGGASYIENATVFTPGTDSDDLDVTLAANGVITGTVTGATNKPVAGVWVTSYRFDGDDWFEYSSVKTSAKGVYSLTDIDPGSYKLKFTDQTAAGHLQRYSGNAATLDAAAPIYVSSGKTATSSIKLALGGRITGTALLDDGWYLYFHDRVQPVAYRVTTAGGVITSRETTNPYYGVRADSRGRWTMAGLPTGSYIVRLVPYYNDIRDGYVTTGVQTDNPLQARVFSVTAGKAVSAGTAETFFDAATAATVRVRSNVSPYLAIPNAHVELTLKDLGDEWYTASTDTSGYATIGEYEGEPGLRGGLYELTVTAPGFEPQTSDWSVTEWNTTREIRLVPTATPLAFSTAATLDSATSAVGDTLTVSATTSRTAELDYLWLRDGVPIFGARGDTYRLGGGDLGHHISVRVGAYVFGHPVKYSFAHVGGEGTLVSVGAAAVNTSAPSILAPAVIQPGTKLTANAGTWDVSGVRPVYAWMRGAVTVGTGSTYVATAADVENDIQLVVVATKAGRPDSLPAGASSVHVDRLAAPVAKVAPKITAKKVGAVTTYTVAPGTWTAGTTFTYSWTVDGNEAGTGKAFAANATHAGKSIVVRITAQQPGSLWTQRALVAVKGTKLAAPQTAPVVINTIEEIAVTDAAQPVRVGQPLTVLGHTGTWVYPDGSTAANFTYQWRKSVGGKAPVAIKGATKAGYTPTVADLNGSLSLAVTANSPVYASTTVVLPAGVVALDQRLIEQAPLAGITGYPYGGSTLSATVGPWPVAGVTVSYQWLRNGVAIPKATAASYTTTAAQFGSEIRVRITATKAGFASVVLTPSILLVSPASLDTIEPPQITGGLVEGSGSLGTPLVVTPGVYNLPGLTRTYVWERFVDEAWSPVAGTPAGTRYTPVFADFGSAAAGLIRVTETVDGAGFTQAHTAQVVITEGTNAVVTAPKVTASKTAWSITDGTWRAPGTTVAWEWSVNGEAVAPTTARSLIFAGTAGTTVTATATVTAPGYATLLREVLVQKGAKPTATAVPITGSPAVGSTLQAPTGVFTYPGWSGESSTVTYQWLLNKVAIKGATAATYVPRATDLGKTITVTLTSRSASFVDGLFTSAAVKVVAGTITGSATLVAPSGVLAGSTISAGLSGYPGSVVHAYQWQSAPAGSPAFVAIAGATKAGYIPKLTEVGRDLRVRVTTTRAGFTAKTTYSDVATILTPSALAPVIAPAITAPSITVGSTLTVSPGTWNVAATTFGYQWYRNGVAIPGATATTFVPLADSYNDELWVVVTAKSVGYATATAQSGVVTPGLGAAPVVLAGKGPKITGAATVCSALTASSGTWNLDGLTFTYAWSVGGEPAGTGRTLDLGFDHIGKTATVTVSASRAGYVVGTATSAASAVVTNPISCAP